MDVEDSASDRPSSHRHSRRESPHDVDEKAHTAQDFERSTSRRTKSRKTRERNSAERQKHTPSRQRKALSDPAQDLKPSYKATSASRKSDHTRHQRKKSRSRDVNSDEFIETPVTRVLREVPDDIQDTQLSNLSGVYQSSFNGDGDNEIYRIQKGRDCVYVEHYDGFSSVARHNALTGHHSELDKRWFDFSTATALHVAIAVQKTWLPLADFCHGLLAGIALMQAIVVDRLFGSSPEEIAQFISLYSNFALIYTTTFLLLATVCIVSIFDRLDLAGGDWPYLVDFISIRPRLPWLLIPVYGGGLILALAAAKGDDLIHLSQYGGTNFTLIKTDLDLLRSWHVLNSLRCACVVMGWLLMSACHPPDLLLNLLMDMLSHQNVDAELQPKAQRCSTF